MLTGTVFDIQKFSIHDGPGIRTTVFLKGCPLRCVWCHNPESQHRAPQLSFNPERCIGCGFCFAHCEHSAHVTVDGLHRIDRTRCVVCGACTEGCYPRALEIIGRRMSVDDVIADVLRDKPFYETSGGGMTVSGGEPFMQLDFTAALLERARAEGLHTCIETCGFAPSAHIERLRPLVDLWLYDLKETDNARHREVTGVPNDGILANLRHLHDRGAAIVLRLPLVPGVNDSDDHFAAVAALVRDLPDLHGVEIMPYHKLGEGKLQRLGMQDVPRVTLEPPEADDIAAWIDRFARLGVNLLNEPPA